MHNKQVFNKVFIALLITYFESSHLHMYFKRYEGAINRGTSVWAPRLPPSSFFALSLGPFPTLTLSPLLTRAAQWTAPFAEESIVTLILPSLTRPGPLTVVGRLIGFSLKKIKNNAIDYNKEWLCKYFLSFFFLWWILKGSCFLT